MADGSSDDDPDEDPREMQEWTSEPRRFRLRCGHCPAEHKTQHNYPKDTRVTDVEPLFVNDDVCFTDAYVSHMAEKHACMPLLGWCIGNGPQRTLRDRLMCHDYGQLNVEMQ